MKMITIFSYKIWKTSEYSCLGKKTRITINDGRTYEGFADESYLSWKDHILTLKLYDIDYETFGLRSGHMTTIFTPIDIIAKIETIIISNPRWGCPPINEFKCNFTKFTKV